MSAHLQSVPKESYVGVLNGTRNRLAFTTRRYKNEPLAVGGPGAGGDSRQNAAFSRARPARCSATA